MKTPAVALSAALLAGGLGLAAGTAAAGSVDKTRLSAARHHSHPTKNIVQIAESDPDLSTLVTAVKAAGLVKALEGKGPFTLFAPTNADFAALPAGTVQTLLQPANRSELTSILTYHVVPGDYTSSNLPTGSVKTLNGATITVNENDGQVDITDGKGDMVHVTEANIKASNGVVHVISGVLMPPAS